MRIYLILIFLLLLSTKVLSQTVLDLRCPYKNSYTHSSTDMVWDKNNNQISTVTTPTEPTTYTDQGVDFLKFTFDKNNYIKFQNKEGVFSTNILENRFGTWDKNKIKMKTYNRSNENQINLFIEFETIDDKKSKLKVEINLNVDRTNGDYDLVENIDLSFDSGKIEGKETRFNKELTDSKKHGICSTYSKKF